MSGINSFFVKDGFVSHVPDFIINCKILAEKPKKLVVPYNPIRCAALTGYPAVTWYFAISFDFVSI